MKVKETNKGNVKLVLSLGEATSLYHLLEQSSMEEWEWAYWKTIKNETHTK